METTSHHFGNPRIAALVPAYNEAPVIEGTIVALRAAHFEPGDIYVADDCSSDATAALARDAGVNVHTVPVNGGKARAQIAALAEFGLLDKYDYVVFLDGDTLVEPGFRIEMLRACARRPDAGLFVGQVRSLKDDHVFSASRANEYIWGDVLKAGQSNFDAVYVAPGCASMYSTRVLRRLVIDPGTLAEDMDLTIQVHRAHERVVYVPGAIVNTQDPGTLRDYHKQVLRWYRGFWQVALKHGVFGWRRKQAVDLYMIYVVADGFAFNRATWLAALLLTGTPVTAWLLAGDAAIGGAIACYCALRARRLDVFLKFPVYYWLSYVSLYAFMRSFVEIVLQRKRLLAWNKVRRYEFNFRGGVQQ